VKQFEATILKNRKIAESWRELVLSWDSRASRPQPGQFLTLRVSPRYDPLLRRPFAFSGVAADASSVSVLYQVRGSATRILSELALESTIDIVGPLGRAFPKPGTAERSLLAAGGMGLGPILFLAQAEMADGTRATLGPNEPLFALGFRDAASIPDIELPAGTILCTDDGSAGMRGRPLDYISLNAARGGARVYACGPAAMLAAFAELARERSWNASLSAEQWMACGVGACMGCALPRPSGQGFLRACADGPVFERDEIDWAALA